MIRILAALSALAGLGFLLAGVAIVSTGCTEPGGCSAPGELGRATVGGFFWAFAALVAATLVFGAIRLARSRKGSR